MIGAVSSVPGLAQLLPVTPVRVVGERNARRISPQDHAEISELARTRRAAEARGDESGRELSQDEAAEVRQLQARDREVRAHENAHKAAAGSLAAGGPEYQTQTGPDGRRYAVGGHVDISLQEGRTPQDTLRIAQQAQRAANAPEDPSPQDRSVAAKASVMAAEARQEIAEERRQRVEGEPDQRPSEPLLGTGILV